MKIGDIIEVHFIRALGPDLWVPAKIISMLESRFSVEAVKGHTFNKDGHTLMSLRYGGNKEQVPQWR